MQKRHEIAIEQRGDAEEAWGSNRAERMQKKHEAAIEQSPGRIFTQGH